jgi:hypothetical protein
MNTLIRTDRIFFEMSKKVYESFIGSRFSPAKTPMKPVKPVGPGLPLDLIYTTNINFVILVVLRIRSSIGPTIAAFVIAEAAQNPAN